MKKMLNPKFPVLIFIPVPPKVCTILAQNSGRKKPDLVSVKRVCISVH